MVNLLAILSLDSIFFWNCSDEKRVYSDQALEIQQ